MCQISILLPTYNPKFSYLKQSIDSVLSQDFSDWELIVIDDHSSVDVKEMIDKILEDNKIKIKYVRNAKNMGPGYSLNKGIELSSGKFIARIDDDDYRGNNDKLTKQFNFLSKNKDYAICGTDMIIIDKDGNILDEVHFKKTDSEIRDILLVYNQFVHSGVMLNKEYICSLGGYNASYLAAQDYEFWCRLGKKYKFANLNNVYIYYRKNPNSIGVKKKKRQLFNSIKIVIANFRYYPNALRGLLTKIFLFLVPEKVVNIIPKLLHK